MLPTIGVTKCDDIPLDQRRFRLLVHGGRNDGDDVLGAGEDGVGWDNVFISLYTIVVNCDRKQKDELAVGESLIVEGNIAFHSSDRQNGVSYRLLRVK